MRRDTQTPLSYHGGVGSRTWVVEEVPREQVKMLGSHPERFGFSQSEVKSRRVYLGSPCCSDAQHPDPSIWGPLPESILSSALSRQKRTQKAAKGQEHALTSDSTGPRLPSL